MPLAASVLRYLKTLEVPWQEVLHARTGSLSAALAETDISAPSVAVAELAIDPRGVVMMVFPMGASPSLSVINAACQRRLQPLTVNQAMRLFRDCEPGSIPVLGGAYGLKTIVDQRLSEEEHIYFQSGCHTTLVKVSQSGWQRLMKSATPLDLGPGAVVNIESAEPAPPQQREEAVAGQLKKLYKLPPMPGVAARLLTILRDEKAQIEDLVQVIESDQSLAAQIMREANSPLYGYRGELANIREAIVRVLGYDRVSQIALGISALSAFEIPREGRLGLDRLWQHGLLSARLCEQLADWLPEQRSAFEGIYLAALLQNFGFLLLGHLFRPEYQLLVHKAEFAPEKSITELESSVLGMGGARELVGLGHGKLGAILLEHWELPMRVQQVARHHPFADYSGDGQQAVRLVRLVNILLRSLQLGDDLIEEDPLPLIQALGLLPEQVQASWMAVTGESAESILSASSGN